MNPKGLQPVEILLVEDSPTDVLLAKEALEYSKIANNLHTVPDGVEAMAFLRREGKYQDAPRPGLILLDLNLPRKDGREVLAEIKNRRETETHSGRGADDLEERGRRAESLRAARQLLHREAGELRASLPRS